MKIQQAVLEQFRAPFVLRTVDVEPGPEEVLVRVRATGICGRDRVIWKGGFRGFRLPAVLGHEFVGTWEDRPVGVYPVVTCGTCDACRSGKENLCLHGAEIYGEQRPGGYATGVVVPRSLLFDLPDDRFEAYAAALCPVATALHAARVAKLEAGMRVLVTGAGGGVGIHMIQVFQAMGARVVALTSPGKADFLASFGVEVVTARRFRKAVGRVDVVFENVGRETLNESLMTLRPEGTLVLVGNVSGAPLELLRPALSIMREHRLVGSAAYTRREYEEAARWIADGRVRPVYEAFPLSAINEVYPAPEQRVIRGRAVLVP